MRYATIVPVTDAERISRGGEPFASSPVLREAMERAGVQGAAQICFTAAV
jgi:hypothetical protein